MILSLKGILDALQRYDEIQGVRKIVHTLWSKPKDELTVAERNMVDSYDEMLANEYNTLAKLKEKFEKVMVVYRLDDSIIIGDVMCLCDGYDIRTDSDGMRYAGEYAAITVV